MDPVHSGSSAPVLSFQLSPSTLLKIHKGENTFWSINGSSDAIVNSTNERMLGGGGIDGAIHRAAGPELLEACKQVRPVRPGVRCPTGEARITPGFRLPVSHVIHTVGPIYEMDKHPDISLINAHKNCLKIAKENNIEYIAFPAISCGVFRYPHKEASRLAVSTVKEFSDGFKEVHFVICPEKLYYIWVETAQEGFCFPVSHVIHTVGPIYDIDKHPDVSLKMLTNILTKEASKLAVSTVNELSDGLKEVHFVLFSDELYDIWVETSQEFLQ